MTTQSTPTQAQIAEQFRIDTNRHVRQWVNDDKWSNLMAVYNRYVIQEIAFWWMVSIRMQLQVPGEWLENSGARTIIANAAQVHPFVFAEEANGSAWWNKLSRDRGTPWRYRFHTIKYLDDTGRLLPKWLPQEIPVGIIPPFNPEGLGTRSEKIASRLNFIGGAKPDVFNTRTAPLDMDSSIQSVEFNGLTLPMLADSTHWTLTTTNDQLTLAATPTSQYATVEIMVEGALYEGPVNIEIGVTNVVIVVTAEDDSQTTYTIAVTR